MSETTIRIPGKLVADEYGTKLANVSDLDNDVYGPYASVSAAHAALQTKGLNIVGTTVGISGDNNMITEYWYQGGTSVSNLVKKQSGVTVDAYTKTESDNKYQPKGNYQPEGDYATKTELNGKVDNVPGKGLSTNDYTDADKQKVAAAITEHQDISGKANTSDVEAALALKADKRDVNDGLDLKANKSSVYTKDETYNKTELNNMITTPDQKFVSVTATDQTTAVTDLLPASGEADTIYRVGNWDGTQYDVSRYTEYAWNGTDYVPLDVKECTLAAEEDFDNPNPSSADKVPTVGAIQGWSGMKHIENPEFLSVLTDNNDEIIVAVKKDGSIFFGAGVPQQVRDFVELVAQELYKSKVEKEDGKSLIDKEYADGTTYEDYTEYAEIIIDKVGKMIEGIRKSGEHVFNSNGIEINGNGISIIDNPEYTFVVLDAKNRVLFGSKVNGGFSSSELDSSAIKQYVDTQIDEDKMERYKGILSTLNRTSSKISGGVPTNIYSNLVLACMTDPHNMRPAVIRFCNFVKRFKDYFNDAICLGDVVSGQFDHYTPEYNSIDGYNNILLALGNHDAYDNESLETVLPESDCYAQYYNGLIENWGVTYTQGKCYYYKDYTHQNIRLVMVDCMHWDSTQRTWFVNTLNNAKTAGLHVVVGSHIPIISDISDITPFDGCTFVSMDFLSTHYDTPTRDIPSIVDSFIQDGGVFACYLFGHWHADYVGTYTQYPNQIVIVQACAANFTFHRDTAYDTKYFEDQFSIYSFDSYYKFIRVLRVGAPYDRNLRHKESMLITYDVSVENKLLSNF